jgi:hypothetical protein
MSFAMGVGDEVARDVQNRDMSESATIELDRFRHFFLPQTIYFLGD